MIHLMCLLMIAGIGADIGAKPKGAKFGPPPPGYIKIRGEAVPGWQPSHATVGRPGPASPMNWYLLGPKPILDEFWSGNDDASGRVVSIAPHPTDPNTVYIAAASGGVWKTTDGGLNWTPLTDELPNINSGCVALDPSDPETVYYGTGEYTTVATGDGLFKSTDGGATWDRVATVDQVGTTCSGLAIDPTNPQIIHMTGHGGYVRSTDGGQNWTAFTGRGSSLVLHPDDPNIVYVGKHISGVFRSTDGGATFKALTNGLPGVAQTRRVLLAVAKTNPDMLFTAIISPSNGLTGLYRTDDGGDSWTQLANTPNFPTPQGWYDAFIAVDPTNEQNLWAGGVFPTYAEAGVIKSTNGGASWTDVSIRPNGQVHPDEQAIAFGPDGTMWVANDGGIWKTNDQANTWINCNATLTVTQNYNIALNPQNQAQVLGGTQDVGTVQRIQNVLEWPQAIGGDGGFAAYDFDVPSRFYTTYVFLATFRHFNGDITDISGPWNGDPANFIAPLIMDPNDSHTLLGGTNRVWRNTSAHISANWTAISTNAVGGGATLNAIAVAEGDSDVIYVGASNGKVAVTTDGGGLWNDRTAGLPAGQVSDIFIDPDAHGTAYVSFHNTGGTRIARTDDFGLTWTNVTGDMPKGVSARALAVDWRHDPHVLYSGSGVGVYSSVDGGVTWIKDGNDLPNVNIGDLAIDFVNETITAGTYGRGTWRSALANPTQATVVADAYALIRGAHVAGDVADLAESDDQRLVINAGITLQPGEPPIWLTVDGTATTASPGSMTFTVESRGNTPALAQTIELYNFNDKEYEEFDSRPIGTVDSVVEIAIGGDLSRFVEPGTLTMRAQITYQPPALTLTFPWSAGLDQVIWTITE